MKFTITREQLHEGLGDVYAAVPTKTTLPVLANILLEATRDGLRLSGTDLDIAVEGVLFAGFQRSLLQRLSLSSAREIP